MDINKYSKYSDLVLRVGLGIVILWFGLNELLKPEMWTSWVPGWATSFGLSEITIVYLNGTFETVLSIALIFGFFTRVAAVLLFLHMILIIIDIGLTAIGMRDFGLAAALLAIALTKKDELQSSN